MASKWYHQHKPRLSYSLYLRTILKQYYMISILGINRFSSFGFLPHYDKIYFTWSEELMNETWFSVSKYKQTISWHNVSNHKLEYTTREAKVYEMWHEITVATAFEIKIIFLRLRIFLFGARQFLICHANIVLRLTHNKFLSLYIEGDI